MLQFALRLLFVAVGLAASLTIDVNRHLYAASNSAPEPTREQLQLQVSIMADHIKKLEAALGTRPGPANAALEQAYVAAKMKEYEYQAQVRDAAIQALKTQRIASNVVLFLVILVVVAGISFAGFQLWKSVSVAGVQTSNELEVSASKVRVTSSVVGVIVLTISLVFLYIYTQEIYHIRIIGAGIDLPEKTGK